MSPGREEKARGEEKVKFIISSFIHLPFGLKRMISKPHNHIYLVQGRVNESISDHTYHEKTVWQLNKWTTWPGGYGRPRKAWLVYSCWLQHSPLSGVTSLRVNHIISVIIKTSFLWQRLCNAFNFACFHYGRQTTPITLIWKKWQFCSDLAITQQR